ncbi:MAG: ABC transporter substrate-binding protein [Spirochaetes bacterium]|nr:ABC transporter substrate-binding protein [Spirochaetota bacterium]
MKRSFFATALSYAFSICTAACCAAGTGTDSLGNRVLIPDTGARIVSLSPGATEVLFALGLDEEIVGISDFCNYPPGLTSTKQTMGGFSTPNMERIKEGDPHVLVLTKSMPIELKHQFERLGIQLFVAESKSFDGLLRVIVELGKLTGKRNEAVALAGRMEEEAGRIVEAVHTKSVVRVTTLIEIWSDPYYAAGKNTLPGDIVRLAGGRVVPDSSKEYPLLSEEAIIEIDPEALILGHASLTGDIAADHRNVSSIHAIRNNKVLVPDPDEFLRPGPRVIDALEEIARFLHPEAF